jgi:hypothetical protein
MTEDEMQVVSSKVDLNFLFTKTHQPGMPMQGTQETLNQVWISIEE